MRLIFIFVLFSFTKIFSQNGIIGDGFTNGWTNADIIEFIQGAGQSRIVTINPDTGGNKFFRLVTRWDGNDNQWGPSSVTDDLEVSIASVIDDVVENSTDKAYEILNTNNANNYVFKTRGAGNPPANPEYVVFEIQGGVRTINGVSQNIPASEVFFDDNVTITATLNDNLNTGQGVYLRYTTGVDFTVSTVVEMTGSGTIYTADIPASINVAGENIQYYVFTSGTDNSNNALTINGNDADFFTINLNNNLESNYSYTVRSEYITQAGATDWNNTDSWRADAIPPNGADVIIAHDLNLNDNITVQSIEINPGATFTNSGQTITIGNNGYITNNGSFIDSSGTVIFDGVGSVFGEVEFTDVEINGSIDFGDPNLGNQSTINGNLSLNPSGFVNGNSPVYGTNSTLIYASNNTYGRRSEWSNANATQGNPHNVQITGTTILDLGFEASRVQIPAEITGNLTLDSDAGLYMDGSNNMESPLIVGGDFTNNGEIRLSQNTFNSATPMLNGDLRVSGDFTNNGIFVFNDRALFFTGNNVQNLNVTSLDAQFEIPFLVIDKNGGEVVLNKNVSVFGDGVALEMKNNSILNLNGTNLVIGETGTNTTVSFSSNSFLRSSTNSNLTLKGTQNFDDIPFEPSANILANIYLEKENNSSVGLANEVMLKEGITLKNGVLNSNGNLIFVSDANNTAIVRPEVDGTFNGTINGDVVVQRHFPLINRAFRYISTPVNTSTTINQNWQEGATSTEFDPSPGFGTHITGAQGTIGEVSPNGLDYTQTGNYSLFTFDETSQNDPWNEVTSTNDPADIITIGKPYALMIRGDRSAPLDSNTDQGLIPAILRTRGEFDLNGISYQFDAPYTPPIIPDDLDFEFVLVGNPYQSQVNMIEVLGNVGNSGISPNFIWIWDPTLTDKGAYAYVDLSDPMNISTLPATSDANEFLQPFQAVFVEVDGPSPQTLNFEKDDIDNSEIQTTVFSEINSTSSSKVEIELYNTQNNLLLDAVRLQFDSSYNDAKTFEDASKFWNLDEYLAILNNNSYLSIDKRNLPQTNDTIPLYLGNYQTTQYTLQLESTLDDDIEAQLYDHYLDQTLDLVNGNNSYDFTVDSSIPESIDNQRFELIFNPETLSTTNSADTNFFIIYPNPTEDILYIHSDSKFIGQDLQMNCFDQMGRLVLSQNISNLEDNTALDLSQLSAGLYLLKLDTEGHQQTFKVQIK